MSLDNPIIIPVPFHGDTIIAVETAEATHVAIKPICERLGLSDKGQIQRLKRDEEFWGGCVMHLPSAGGMQETYCIPVSRVAAWLFTVEVSRVKPEIREALTLYRREAADVLDRHFRLRLDERTEEIRQLRGQLSHCHANLRAALPKWGQIISLLETGTFGHATIAARVAMTQDRLYEEQNAIARCGMLMPEGVADNTGPSWLDRIAWLERQLQFARDELQAQARDMSLAEYRRSQGRGAETEGQIEMELALTVKAEQPDV
jgi:hypothetical protein